jgi:hypothetical protein
MRSVASRTCGEAMRVSVRGRDAGVAEDFLDDADVDALLNQQHAAGVSSV